MALRSTLRARVARRTGRAEVGEATDITNEAFDEFLTAIAGPSHNFKVMQTTLTLAFTSTEYSNSLPIQTSITGFESAVHQVLSMRCYLTDSSAQSTPFTLRAHSWLQASYPDRRRTGASGAVPRYGAILNGALEIQAPSSGSYTVEMVTSHLPSAFASDATSNPIPLIDSALVAWGIAEVYDSIEQFNAADRWRARAMVLLGTAVQGDQREPALVHAADIRGMGEGRGPRFNQAQLDSVYPGDVV